jgi:hypothetical protein
MYFLKYIIIGAVAKVLASFDDVVARLPVIAQLTDTHQGRLAFALGNLLAVTAGLILAWFFSSILAAFPHTHTVVSLLVLLLAIAVYFDWFGKKRPERIEQVEKKVKRRISTERFMRLLGIGFIVSLVTLLDDTVVLVSLLIGPAKEQIAVIIGIYVSTFIQLALMVFAAKKISRLKYIKEIASLGLVVLSVLLYLRVI